MILNLVFALVTVFIQAIFGLMPEYTAPEWLVYDPEPGGGSVGYAFWLGAQVYHLRGWVPTELMGTALIFLGTLIPAVVTAAVAMLIWSFLPIVGRKGS